MGSLATTGLLNIIVSIICIAASWWALQSFRFDLFVKKANSAQSKLLQILLSIVIGSGVARFLMEYLASSLLLRDLF
ncbi:DUF1146 domain-containing protein [Brevibacillus fluminis]|uniref:DUF1146 domain-containing protein n=1 Tax=Brevibacillus fluminis TaxID=511487 RepID=A0A3M8D2Y4_9BACL|nr:DUF1146 family protein [Brevibacillus fluminis]RNB82059.1 DUF1146 domain-containing protein [Brevibacillus fluminis]